MGKKREMEMLEYDKNQIRVDLNMICYYLTSNIIITSISELVAKCYTNQIIPSYFALKISLKKQKSNLEVTNTEYF